jgi:hypothetical protein
VIEKVRENARRPASFWADIGTMLIKTWASLIWEFCAPARR